MAYSIEDIRALESTDAVVDPPPVGVMVIQGYVPADAPPLPRPITPEPEEEEPDVEGLCAAYEAALEHERDLGIAQTQLKRQRDEAAGRIPVLQRQRDL